MDKRNTRGTEEYQEGLFEAQTSQPQSIGDLMARFNQAPKQQQSEDKAKHERAFWVEKTRKALGIHWKTGKPYTYGQVNGLTRSWSVYQIRDRFIYCEKYGNPFSKVWFGMRKQAIEKAKETASV